MGSMMRMQHSVLLGSVLLVACGDTGNTGDTDGPGSTTGVATDTGSSTTDPATETGGTGGTADTDGTSGTDSTSGTTGTSGSEDSTGGTTGEVAQLEVTVMASSVAVLEADESGQLTVDCVLSEDGLPLVDPGAFTVSLAPDEGFTEVDGTYTFPDTAVFEVSCAIDYQGQTLERSRTVSVLNESIDPGLAELGGGLGQAIAGVVAVIASDELDDAVLVEAIAQLDAALPMLESTRVAELDDVLRQLPGGYPTGPELEAAGIMPNADDVAFEAALDELDAALVTFEATMSAADPMSTDEALLDALEGDLAAFEEAVSTLRDLSPSSHGLMAQRARVATLLGERMQPAVHQSVQYLSARIHAETGFAEAPPAGTSFHFGILSFTLGMFGQNNLRVQLLNDWYGDYVAQLDESINNLALAGLIDEAFPIGGAGPVIELLQASASLGFATPGYPSWIDGYNFDENDSGLNLVLVFGDSWQGVVDNIITGCGIEASDHAAEAVEKFFTCAEDLEAAVDSIFWYPVSVGPGVFGSLQGLDMGPFPAACSGPLPTATVLVPMTWTGRGPSYVTNCI